MKILAHLPTLGLEINPAENDIEQAIQKELDKWYEPENSLRVSVQDYMLGYFHTDLIKYVAYNWNTNIKKNFLNALMAVLPDKPLSKITADEIEADTIDTFNLEIAVNCLNNTWDRTTPYCTIYPSLDGSRTQISDLLQEITLEDIETNPEDYAIITVATSIT